VVVTGLGFARSEDKKADEPKPAKKDEPKKADDQPKFDPKDVRVGPPPELAALRSAVEEAAKKGENVDEIRNKLNALETALAGKPWVKPTPAGEPPAPQPFPGARAVPPRAAPPFPGGIQPLPFPGVQVQPFAPDLETIQKAQKLMLEAAQLRDDDPKKAAELMKEARELMMKGLRPGLGGGLMLPDFPNAGGGNVRLGVRVESVPPAIADKNHVPEHRGVRVAEVVPNTPAEKAGLKAGDIITEFAGKPVGDDPTEFVRSVRGMKAGAKVDIAYVRDGKKNEAKGVALGDGLQGALPNFNFNVVPRVELNPGALELPDRPLRGGAKGQSTSVRIENGTFTINSTEGGVKFRIEGAAATGKPTKIEVTDGDKTVEAASVNKLPAEYRNRARQLLDTVKVED
jgi:hypothetical protein